MAAVFHGEAAGATPVAGGRPVRVHVGHMFIGLIAAGLVGVTPSPVVLHTARAPGAPLVEWLADAKDPSRCSAMRFTVSGGARLTTPRFSDTCSAVRDAYAPGGRWAVFQLGPMGPFHVVAAASMAGYVDGGMPDAVVYPSETHGMPPQPERLVTFLGWVAGDAFELTGASDGALRRYTFNATAAKATQTCFLDAYRLQCAFPSPDGRWTVFVPREGFHVVTRDGLGAFLTGNGGDQRFPALLPAGLTRPVFQRWLSGEELLLRAAGESGVPVELTFRPAVGTLSAPRPVPVGWPGWPARPAPAPTAR